jgi:hypothetical protein
MFARSVSMRLKDNNVSRFNSTLEDEVLPPIRKQNGFRDELVLISSNGDAIGISLWDRKDNAEAYQRETYPEVQRLLSKVTEGIPQVRELSVSVRTGRCFRKKEPIESGSPMPGEQGIHVVADAVAEVVADDAHAIEANDQWIAVAGG